MENTRDGLQTPPPGLRARIALGFQHKPAMLRYFASTALNIKQDSFPLFLYVVDACSDKMTLNPSFRNLGFVLFFLRVYRLVFFQMKEKRNKLKKRKKTSREKKVRLNIYLVSGIHTV